MILRMNYLKVKLFMRRFGMGSFVQEVAINQRHVYSKPCEVRPPAVTAALQGVAAP